MVFAGCTNGGTQLAEPENWRRFADTYTNLALAAARALSLIPGAQGWPQHRRRGDPRSGDPGEGPRHLRRHREGRAGSGGDGAGRRVRARHQPAPGGTADGGRDTDTTRSCPTSRPRAALAQGATPELPPKLLMRIADWGADELYGEPNDLVVHVRSMTHIDPTDGDLRQGSPGLRHEPLRLSHQLLYPRDTAARLTEWLGLSNVAPAKQHLPARVAPKRKPGPTKRGGGGRGGGTVKKTPSKLAATKETPAVEKAAAKPKAKKAAARPKAMRPASKAPAKKGGTRGASGGVKETTDKVILPGVVLRKRGARRAKPQPDEQESTTGRPAKASVVATATSWPRWTRKSWSSRPPRWRSRSHESVDAHQGA